MCDRGMNQGPACRGVLRRAPGGDPRSWVSQRCFSRCCHPGVSLGEFFPGHSGKELRLAARKLHGWKISELLKEDSGITVRLKKTSEVESSL